jgi:hypothetical protein
MQQPMNKSIVSLDATSSSIKQNARGRPKRYNRELALDQAMRLF